MKNFFFNKGLVAFIMILSGIMSGTDLSARVAAPASRVDNLVNSSDSMVHLLSQNPNDREKLILLVNLSDIGSTLNDYTYTRKLWDEAVRLQVPDAIQLAGSMMSFRYLNRALLDSADYWIEKCNQHLIGENRHATLTFLETIRNIRDISSRNELVQKILEQKSLISGNEQKRPYENMKLLYELAIIAISDLDCNDQLEMREWYSYMAEGLEIANKLPLKQSFRFRHQFLLGLSAHNVKYVKQLLDLMADYENLPENGVRKFLPRNSEILACSRMLRYGDLIGRKEIDLYFKKYVELATKYPFASSTPLDFSFYNESVNYYEYIGDFKSAHACCDSMIANGPKYKIDANYVYLRKCDNLERLELWEEAYNARKKYQSIKDSLMAASTANELMELQTRYDVSQLQYEKEKKHHQALLFLMTSILLVAILGVMSYSFRKVRQRNLALCAQINTTGKSLTQLHRVKLQVTERKIERSEELSLFDRFEKFMSDPANFTNSAITRDWVVGQLSTNSTYLSQAINDGCGLSFTEYLSQCRMRYALELMQEYPEYSQNEISEKIGYNSYSGFFRAFKKQYNVSPAKYMDFVKGNASA